MICATCGKEGCHPNYHKTIAQIIEEGSTHMWAHEVIDDVSRRREELRRLDLSDKVECETLEVTPMSMETPVEPGIWEAQSAIAQKELDAAMDRQMEVYLTAAAEGREPTEEELGPRIDTSDWPPANPDGSRPLWPGRGAPPCPVCGGWTVMELGRAQRRCVAHPEHAT